MTRLLWYDTTERTDRVREETEMTGYTDPDPDGVRDTVDGVPVVTRAGATQTTPLNHQPVALTGVDEVLLMDDRTVYQCVMDPVTCTQWFTKVTSARAHMAKHSQKRVARRLTTKRDAETQRRVVGRTEGAKDRANRILVVEGDGLGSWLREEATALEERARYLRAAAVVADRLGSATVNVTPDELTALREKAAQYDVIQSALRPVPSARRGR
jgi:hypothetical protein